jgi:RNA polymerase-binding transcription factor DksA
MAKKTTVHSENSLQPEEKKIVAPKTVKKKSIPPAPMEDHTVPAKEKSQDIKSCSQSATEKSEQKIQPVKTRYTEAELEHFKQLIIARQSENINQLQNLRDLVLDPATGEFINENSLYSSHMAEQGTDAMEREKNYLYTQREDKFLGYLEEALLRIEDGTYGICSECIDEPKFLCKTCPLIPKERLEAVPHSQLCIELKKRQDKLRQ